MALCDYYVQHKPPHTKKSTKLTTPTRVKSNKRKSATKTLAMISKKIHHCHLKHTAPPIYSGSVLLFLQQRPEADPDGKGGYLMYLSMMVDDRWERFRFFQTAHVPWGRFGFLLPMDNCLGNFLMGDGQTNMEDRP